MKVVIQRVSEASVKINCQIVSSIGYGLLVLVGFEDSDNDDDLVWLTKKITQLRIFPDTNQVMNLSMLDVEGQILVVSQFTLHASTKKGNRPSYIKAAKPEIAIPLYDKFIRLLQSEIKCEVKSGEFGADMEVSLINDGPVTIVIDTKNKV